MDQETFEQPGITAEVLDEAVNYLKPGMDVNLFLYEGEPLDIELPTTVDLEVTKAEAAVRGDTATGVSKLVTTETGLKVHVPAFINQGDLIGVDPRRGESVPRVYFPKKYNPHP